MSRILRRPMFRGGRVDSRGTGITSGLMDEPRVEAQQGLFVGMDPRYSGFGTQQPTVTSEELIRSYTPLGIPQYLQDLYQSNVSQIVDDKRFPTITKEEDDDETIISNYPIDRLAEKDQIVPFNLSAKKDKEDILIPKAKPELKDTGISDLEKDKSDLEKDDTDINLEDLYADRLKAAKRGDIADILLGISAGALEEGTLTGAAKGAVEAARQASKSEALKDQIKALETQIKIADRAGNIKQKRVLEQIREAAEYKARKEFEIDRQLELLGPGLYKDRVKKAAYGATNLPEYLRNAKKDLDIGADLDLPTVIAGAKLFAPDFVGTASSKEDVQLDGVYIIPEQKKVIRVKNAGTAQEEYEEIAIF